MPESSKSIARLLVPTAVLAVVGLLIVWPLIGGQGQGAGQGTAAPQRPATPATTPATSPPADAQPTQDPPRDPQGQPTQPDQQAQQGSPPSQSKPESSSQPDSQPQTDPPPPADGGYRVLPVQAPDAYAPLGAAGPDDGVLRLVFSPRGAGVERIELPRHKRELGSPDPVLVQQTWSMTTAQGLTSRIVPFAATAVEVNGQPVNVYTADGRPAWRELGPGRFQATIANDAGEPVLRLERRYVADGTNYAFELERTAENLTDRPLRVRWTGFGPAQLYQESQGYGGEKRRVRFGYVAPGSPAFVVGSDFLLGLHGLSGPRDKATGLYEPVRVLWPNPTSRDNRYELVWVGQTNRYFGVAVHALPDGQTQAAPLLEEVERVERVLLDPSAKTSTDAYTVGLRLVSPELEVAPGSSAALRVGVFAGPKTEDVIASTPGASAVNLVSLVQYTFGGPCAMCTFQWLAHILIALLEFVHDYLTYDWALAIIVLVLIVRTVLHPVTKWSQIRVQRFGHQMQQMAPKQKKLQEKYKDDTKRMQAEMAKLWREEGVNPAGMLGCLPMFLQMPVWVALYATLYFAADLRHQPAFFGVFQQMGGWAFLGDLSQPDSAIPLPTSMHFELPLMGEIASLNVLPFLLALVFFLQQKYLMPPQSATMTPEQLAQQKMIKVMMVVMFPIFMYAAPSGLALYFIANSTLGILESRYIRAHIDKKKLLETPARDPARPSFMQRLIAQAEQRQQAMHEARGQGQQQQGPTSGALGARRKKAEQRRKGKTR